MTCCQVLFARFIIGLIITDVCSARQLGSDAGTSASSASSVGKNQQALLLEWVKALKPKVDYNGTQYWRKMTANSTNPEHYFDAYAFKFSKVAEKLGASVNFISIGSCDGTDDLTIRDGFLKHPHWRGAFVEPISINFAELTNFLAVNGVANRSTAIRGAATSVCTSPFLVMKRPMAEETMKDAPHWLRRQVGSLIPDGQKVDKGWTTEKVQQHTSVPLYFTYSCVLYLNL